MASILVLSLGRTGSLHIYAEDIINHFESDDFKILVSKDRIEKRQVNNSIEVSTYSNKISFLLRTIFYLPYLLLKLYPQIKKEYKILYLPYQHHWDLPFIILFKLLNKKVVFTVHDGILHKGERNFFNQSLTSFRLKKATELIFLTNYVKRLVLENYNLNSKYHVVPLPLITNDYVSFDKDKQTKNVLFLGRIDKYKGVELLMKSIYFIENSIDNIIIAGKTLYNVEFIEHDKLVVKDYYLSEREIGELLSWADLLVLPYTEASQSGVISLGIFSETPMVCTKVGGFSEQLAIDESFWCEPNVKSLSQCIVESFNNNEGRQLMKNKLKLKKQKLEAKSISKDVELILKL